MSLLVTNIGRLFSATDRGVLEAAAVLVEGDRIAWVGPAAEASSAALTPPGEVVDAGGGLVTPGLIDAHTHPFYAGDRLAEIALRSAGADYQEIAAQGGGIRATVEATRAAGIPALIELARARLARWLANGVTTVEAKTGYHLDQEGELAAVAALASLAGSVGRTDDGVDTTRSTPTSGPTARAGLTAGQHPVNPDGILPRVEVTFLAAHDASPDLAAVDDRYAVQAQAAASWSEAAARDGARFVDVFCDAGYFSVELARLVLQAGQEAGLLARIHADELARTGASQLAAELGATSADHLLCATEDDARALAQAGVTATLCPLTAMAMGKQPPARLFADRGVPLALGSDHNPGQAGVTSMSLVVGLAVHLLDLSVDEALVAATAGGARSLAVPDRGSIGPGQLADLVLWDADHEASFAWDLGLIPARVWKGGRDVGVLQAVEP